MQKQPPGTLHTTSFFLVALCLCIA